MSFSGGWETFTKREKKLYIGFVSFGAIAALYLMIKTAIERSIPSLDQATQPQAGVSAPKEQTSMTIGVGYRGKINSAADSETLAFTSEETLIRYCKASAAKDQYGKDELILATRHLKSGQNVLVLSNDGKIVQVRVLDGPDAGEAWWTLTAFIK